MGFVVDVLVALFSFIHFQSKHEKQREKERELRWKITTKRIFFEKYTAHVSATKSFILFWFWALAHSRGEKNPRIFRWLDKRERKEKQNGERERGRGSAERDYIIWNNKMNCRRQRMRRTKQCPCRLFHCIIKLRDHFVELESVKIQRKRSKCNHAIIIIWSLKRSKFFLFALSAPLSFSV